MIINKKKGITMKTLLDIQIASKHEIKELQNKDDYVLVSLTLMAIHATRVLAYLSSVRFSVIKANKPKITNRLIEEMATILDLLFMFANECNHDLPPLDEVFNYENNCPAEIQVDSVLIVMHMITCIAGLTHTIYAETDGFIWEQEVFSDGFNALILGLMACIALLGNRHGFTFDELFELIG